jgi:hypothetical protein
MGELEKAGEFVWGAYAQLVKATALRRNRHLSKHSQLISYAQSITKALDDIDFLKDFHLARGLHMGFYEGDSDDFTIRQLIEALPEWKRKIDELLGENDSD